MSHHGKEFDAFQIFEEIQSREETVPQPLAQRRITDVLSFEEAPYYEMEYDADLIQEAVWETGEAPLRGNSGQDREEISASGNSVQHVGEASVDCFFSEPDQILPREKDRVLDEVRERFNQMRDIAREDRSLNFRSSKFYNQRMQRENSKTFYKQGMFMKDFEDEYEKTVPYSSYFPNYQMMGYDQLRTFFTWRTKVRQGQVEHISLSYAYLYIYELLNNIGVDSPEEGLGQLLFFWDAFRVYDASIDKYVLRWLKDYHIYYDLPQNFADFTEENGLGSYYPELSEEEAQFDSYCAIARYDIRKSSFYTEERADLVQRCFHFTINRLQEAFLKGGFELDSLLYQPARNMSVWVPFKGALFCPARKQPDRQVRLSRREVYVCSHNDWTCSAMITAECGRRLMGYVLKQMESVLRKVTKFKYKLSANPDMLSPVMADELKKAGIVLEKIITDAVTAFYKEETKTVVQVNPGMLEKIRQEAYVTQERLIVPEEENGHPVYVEKASAESRWTIGQPDFEQERWHAGQNNESVSSETGSWDRHGDTGAKTQIAEPAGFTEKIHVLEQAAPEEGCFSSKAPSDEWKILWNSFTEAECEALRIIINGKSNLKLFADEQGIMMEVLAEGINEKAADAIGDGLLDNDFSIYEDYVEQVKEMVKVV